MTRETIKGDAFQQGLVAAIAEKYQNGPLSSINLEAPGTKLRRLQDSLGKWEKLESTLRPTYNERSADEAYKNTINEAIKETLSSFREYLEGSAIFTDDEKSKGQGAYQDLMSVLETPGDPQAIERDTNDISGLYYRDLVNNVRYWETSGAHVQLMRDVSEQLQLISQIAGDESISERREAVQAALETMFTTDRSAYEVAPGGHQNRIQMAKDNLAMTPKETLTAYWNTYVRELLHREPFGDAAIINAVAIGDQVHVPQAIDHIAGVSTEAIFQKDSMMQQGLQGLTEKHQCFLVKEVFGFPQYLAKRLDEELDDLMQGFDELETTEKNVKILALNTYLVKPFIREQDHANFLEALDHGGTEHHKDAEAVKKAARDCIAQGIGSAVGLPDLGFEELLDLEVSTGKRAALIPKEGTLFNALMYITAEHPDVDAIQEVVKSCPEEYRTNMLVNALSRFSLAKKENSFDSVLEACPEEVKKTILSNVLDKLRSGNKTEQVDAREMVETRLKSERQHLERMTRPMNSNDQPSGDSGSPSVKVEQQQSPKKRPRMGPS